MASIVEDPKRWRDRAAEVRRQAAEMRNAEARRVMRIVAEGYEKLAEHAEARRRERDR